MNVRSHHLLISVFLTAASVGCGHETDDSGDGATPTRVPVGLAVVRRDTLVESLTLIGRLAARPGGSAMLTAPAAGVVSGVRAPVGDRVKKGSVVLELDVPELAADASQKVAAAAQAEREAARQQQLLGDGITSRRQAEEATASALQASAAAEAARTLLARTRMRSPIEGRVQEILVQRGERIEAGKTLAQIVSPDTLDLVAQVPAAELRRLRPGLSVDVVEDGDTLRLGGRVAALAPGVDSLTNAGSAVIRVANPGGHLHPGAGAVGRVRVGVRPSVLVVPDSAIVLAGDSSVVFVVGPDSIAHQRPVERGIRDSGRTEVRGDVREGDWVVTTGAFGLQDGMRVITSDQTRTPK
jgi:membrane fusion protein (multidrug efflux system)